MATTPKSASGQGRRAEVARLLGRGAGWGALLGFAGGFVLLGLAVLIEEGLDSSIFVLVVPIGLVSGTIGALYGTVAGTLVAASVLPIRGTRHARLIARLLGAIVGSLAVATLSALVFHPDLEPGPNETEEHVRSNVLLMYLLPGAMAAASAAALTPRLLLGPRDGTGLTQRSG